MGYVGFKELGYSEFMGMRRAYGFFWLSYIQKKHLDMHSPTSSIPRQNSGVQSPYVSMNEYQLVCVQLKIGFGHAIKTHGTIHICCVRQLLSKARSKSLLLEVSFWPTTQQEEIGNTFLHDA